MTTTTDSSERVTHERQLIGLRIEDLAKIDWNSIFGEPVQVRELGRKEVGASYEPRTEIRYEVDYTGGRVSENTALIIHKKRGEIAVAYLRYTPLP